MELSNNEESRAGFAMNMDFREIDNRFQLKIENPEFYLYLYQHSTAQYSY
jgi:hypothetical protein